MVQHFSIKKLSLLEKNHLIVKKLVLKFFFVFFRYLQMPEVMMADITRSTSNPVSINDCTDNGRMAEIQLTDADCQFPLSPTLPNMKSECNERESLNGSVRLPVEYSKLPSDGRDLLVRLLEFNPERRIRSIFALQRIAFFMNFNFDDVRKKKVIIILK